jgi:thymidylate synthase (FAD)
MKVARQSRVTLLQTMGSDIDVVNAARVSFAKEVTEMTLSDVGLVRYLAFGLDGKSRMQLYQDILDADDRAQAIEIVRRIRHTPVHWAPFAHVMAKFRIAAPLFVARQLWKAHIGLANQDENIGWSETSRRYVDDEPEFFIPVGGLRGRVKSVKQGSSDDLVPGSEGVLDSLCVKALDTYNDLLAMGVAPEDARMALPNNLITEWIWTGSVMAFARICAQRLDSHAQSYTSDVAKMMAVELSRAFPVTWEALTT